MPNGATSRGALLGGVAGGIGFGYPGAAIGAGLGAGLGAIGFDPIGWFSGAGEMEEASRLGLRGIAPANAALYGGLAAGLGQLAAGQGVLQGGLSGLDASRQRALSGMGRLQDLVGSQDPAIMRQHQQMVRNIGSEGALRGQSSSSYQARRRSELDASTLAALQQARFGQQLQADQMRAGIEGRYAGLGAGYHSALANMYGTGAGMQFGAGQAAGRNIMAGHGAYQQGMMGAAQATPGLMSGLMGPLATLGAASMLRGG